MDGCTQTNLNCCVFSVLIFLGHFDLYFIIQGSIGVGTEKSPPMRTLVIMDTNLTILAVTARGGRW